MQRDRPCMLRIILVWDKPQLFHFLAGITSKNRWLRIVKFIQIQTVYKCRTSQQTFRYGTKLQNRIDENPINRTKPLIPNTRNYLPHNANMDPEWQGVSYKTPKQICRNIVSAQRTIYTVTHSGTSSKHSRPMQTL